MLKKKSRYEALNNIKKKKIIPVKVKLYIFGDLNVCKFSFLNNLQLNHLQKNSSLVQHHSDPIDQKSGIHINS
jgi:PIN domain nuclease of toxin-antitoxin system